MKKRPPRPTSDEYIENMLDFPHKRGGNWKSTETKERAVWYLNKLEELGMDYADAVGLITDLYWDSYTECKLNEKEMAKAKRKIFGSPDILRKGFASQTHNKGIHSHEKENNDKEAESRAEPTRAELLGNIW